MKFHSHLQTPCFSPSDITKLP